MVTGVDTGIPSEPSSRCLSCGYNLTGLTPGSACPECGLLPNRDQKTHVSLDHAQSTVVHAVAWRVLAGSCLGGIFILGFLAAHALGAPVFVALALIAVLLPICSWLFAWGWNDPIAKYNGLGIDALLLRVARWGSFCWTIYAVSFFFAPVVGGTGGSVLNLLSRACLIGGLLQLACLLSVLGRYARWNRDESAEAFVGFLHLCNWLMLFGAVGGMLVTLFWQSGRILAALPTIIAVLMLVCFLILLYKLGAGVAWSVLHRHENHMYERRRAERIREMGDEMAARVDRADSSRD